MMCRCEQADELREILNKLFIRTTRGEIYPNYIPTIDLATIAPRLLDYIPHPQD